MGLEEALPHKLLFLPGVQMQILEGSSVGSGVGVGGGGIPWSWMLNEGEKVTVTPRLWHFGGFMAGCLPPTAALAP